MRCLHCNSQETSKLNYRCSSRRASSHNRRNLTFVRNTCINYSNSQLWALKHCLSHAITDLDLIPTPTKKKEKAADGLQCLTFHDTSNWFSTALKSHISLGRRRFFLLHLLFLSPHHVRTSEAQDTFLFCAEYPFFCSISNQPFVKGAAKAHKESSCSLAVANVQLPGQMQFEALPRSGCQCTLRPPCTPNASSPGWLSPYGTSNWIPISIFFNTGVNLMKTHNVFQRFYFSKSIIQRHRGCFKKNEIHLFFKIVYVFCSRGYFSILWFSC